MGKNISEKTLQDLEFLTVLQHVATHCISGLGKEKVLEIRPIANRKTLFKELYLVNEYLSSFQNDNRVPNHGFDDITDSVKRVAIENSFIETEAFLKVAKTSLTVNEQIVFFKKFQIIFPTFFELTQKIEFTTYINDEIKQIIEISGEVKNNASPGLNQIRKDINAIRGKISASFSSALSKAIAAGYLDDIKETVVDNQRVLAVMAMHRRKVEGSMLGSSKSGGIVYIAPQATLAYSREYQNLIYEEKQEVIKILRDLATTIRPFVTLLEDYLNFLAHLDMIGAKAKYAHQHQGVLPKLPVRKKYFSKMRIIPFYGKKIKKTRLILFLRA